MKYFTTTAKMKHFTLLFLTVLLAAFAKAQTTATPPSGATVETWNAAFLYHYFNSSGSEQTENIAEEMDVAFDGSDVYFNLPNPITGNSWVKGTLSGNTATFARSQYIGSYSGSKAYLDAMGENGLCDLVLNYDSEKGIFSTDLYVLINSSLTEQSAWCYYTGFTVSKNSGGDGSDVNPDGTITPPASATQENWVLSCLNVNPNDESQTETVKETVKVAFSGSNIYIQGLSAYVPEAWIKGTINGSTATFATRQYMGTGYGYSVYTIGYNGTETDIVFNYDSEKGTLTTDTYILGISSSETLLQQLTNVTLTRQGGDDPIVVDEVVTPPSTLKTTEYVFKGSSIIYDTDGTIAGLKPVQWNVRVGFVGSKYVYIQGLCPYLPDAWVRGDMNSDGEVTFTRGQYFGEAITHQNFYFAGMIFNELSDVVLEWSSSTLTFTGGSYYMAINSQKNTLAPYDIYAGITITRIKDVAATPADPAVAEYQLYNSEANYGYARFEVPTQDVDGNAILMDKLSYRIYTEIGGVQEQYVFTPSFYQNLTEEMSTVPYMYADGWDFYRGGTFVSFYDSNNEFDKIGIQSVYNGGNQEHVSNIVWYNIKGSTEGIETATAAEGMSVNYYDLQGRRATADAKGILLRVETLSDGTTRTTKLVRR